jgi:hypothetical protein
MAAIDKSTAARKVREMATHGWLGKFGSLFIGSFISEFLAERSLTYSVKEGERILPSSCRSGRVDRRRRLCNPAPG